MGDESMAGEAAEEKRGLSRRAALKAGVATGVGIAAWSGVTITSLGGTPAYAIPGCTGIRTISLTDCRNTDQGNTAGCALKTQYGYHPLKELNDLPTGYSVTNNVGEHTCCAPTSTPRFSWNTGETCKVNIEFYTTGLDNCRDRDPNAFINGKVFGPVGPAPGFIDITLCCYQFVDSSTFYQITAYCANTTTALQCVQFPSLPGTATGTCT